MSYFIKNGGYNFLATIFCLYQHYYLTLHTQNEKRVDFSILISFPHIFLIHGLVAQLVRATDS